MTEYVSLSKLKVYGYDNGGFAVVTSDDRFESVIGVSSSQFSGTIPCGFKWWMEVANANMENEKHSSVLHRSNRAGNSISPLLTTIWGQDRPFNDNCTFTNGSDTYQCVTGCVATALSQVMNYHRFPERGTGSRSYDVTYNNSFTITFSEDFSQSVYDWNNMLDSYEAYYDNNRKDEYTQAVAKLMKDCGVATRTSYSDSSHGSSSSLYYVEEALTNYFFYDSSTKYYKRNDYNKDEWLDIIYKEIENGRPVIYSGTDGESILSSGHAFVLHGYDSTGKVYINWGWDGRYDGYFDIDLLNPTLEQYNYNQSMVVAIPSITTTLHDITISVSGSGSVKIGREDGVAVRDGSQVLKAKDGKSVTLFFIPDMGNQLKSVKVDGKDITASITENQYTIDNIQSSISIDAEYEEKTGYISGAYNTYITCLGESLSQSMINSSISTSVGFSITNSGNDAIYIKKLVAKTSDNSSVLFSTTDTSVLGELKRDSKKSLTLKLGKTISTMPIFELEYSYNGDDYAYIASQYYVLTIKTNKYGSVAFTGIPINNTTKKFSIKQDTNAQLFLTPNEGCTLQQVKVNDIDVTSSVSGNVYSTTNISQNTSIDVSFGVIKDEEHSLSGHEYVDLGLSSGKYWSTVNYGADLPEEAGTYYKSINFNSRSWGQDWKTPSKEEFQELIDECEWIWTERNGMKGYRVSGPNGNSMFLPAAGQNDILSTSGLGSKLNYWTSTEGDYGIFMWILSGNESGYNLVETQMVDKIPIRPISTYEPAKYKLTYTVDGEEYKSYEYMPGKAITPEPAPTKEGYTFSGWSEIPETMPAHDVTVTGTFTVNVYTITYLIGNDVFMTETVEYGSAIIVPEVPNRQGSIFLWEDYPETMPAHDIIIRGNYITGIEELKDSLVNVKIFSINGKPLDKLQKGINIIRMSDGKTVKVLIK